MLSWFSVLNTCELQVIWEDETLHLAFHWIMNSFSSRGYHTAYIHLILFVWEQQLWEAGIVLSWCLEHCLVRMNIITLFDLPVSCPASALALTPGTETIFSVLPPFVTHQITLPAAPLLIISFPSFSSPLNAWRFSSPVYFPVSGFLPIHPTPPHPCPSLNVMETCAEKASCAGMRTRSWRHWGLHISFSSLMRRGCQHQACKH